MSTDSNATDRPTRIGSYEVHPFANWFPMMKDDQWKDFLKDVEEKGLQNPVVLFEEKILDGRNRALAACQLGKELKTVQFEDLGTNQSPLEYVISSNLHRRHLTDKQRVEIAKDLAKLLAEEKAKESGSQAPLYKNQNETGRGNKGPASIAAAQVGVSKSAVNRALAQETAKTARANKLATAKLALNNNAAMRDAYTRIARYGGDKLADAILLGEIDIGTEGIYKLAQQTPDELAALAPKILEAKRFPLTDPQAALRNKLRASFSQALERAREQLGFRANEYKAAFQKAISEAAYDELLAFAGIEPGAGLGDIDSEKINEAISLCHHLNKDKPGNQESKISFGDILALRAESIPSSDGLSGKEEQSAGIASQPERSPEELKAIERIARVCAGNNPEALLSWRRALAKVPASDLLDWNRESDENIRQVGALITGDFKHGVREALRIVRHVIDDRTPLSFLKNNCNSQGGHWEHTDGTFLFAVTRADRAVLSRTLCLAAKDSAEYEPIREALEQNKWKLTDSELAGLSSLSAPLLQKILPCLLYGSQPREPDIAFDDIAL